MSQLSDILNSAQITKHYELLQFLSTHANTEYTLAQLDYLLPRGASLQRFPDVWVEMIEAGLFSNQSIEVLRKAVARSSGLGSEVTKNEEEVFLVCRRPEMRNLEDLEKVLQSPSTVQDVEACVALHTDQVILTEDLLRDAQRRGLLYYFPDSYPKPRERKLVKGKRGISASGDALSNFLRAEEEETVLGFGDRQAGHLELPSGVVAQFMLYTRRGVPLRGKNSIPISLSVGERFMVIFEKISSSPAASPNAAVENAPVVRTSLGHATGAPSPAAAPPLDVRVKASRGRFPNAAGGGPRSYMDVRAVACGRVALSLFVDERETVLQMDVADERAAMPGVLVGRPPLPSPPPPDAIRVKDAAVWGEAGEAAPSWWLNPSPAVLQVRDTTLPDSEAVTAAARIVWIPHKRDEAAMKTVRDVLRRQNVAEMERRKARRRQRVRELRNCHMVHYGFDASVPFSGDAH